MADAHLVGSMNLRDPQTVFRTVGALAGPSVARVPDGERGRRVGWIGAQAAFLAGHPALVAARGAGGGTDYGGERSGLVLRPGVDPADVLLDLPYAEDAAESYALFRRLRAEGALPERTRFQVGMPSATATLLSYVDSACHDVLLPRLEASLAVQVRRIVEAVPVEDLAIQWDLAVEFGVLETGLWGSTHYGFDDLFAAAARLGSLVPDGAALGYHLCYGNAPERPGGKGRHFVEPADAGLLVAAANRLHRTVRRPIDWIHLPVPIDRVDDAYVRPLGELDLAAGTRLYLGLVHDEDGRDGAAARVAAASRHVTGFGVGTECGMANEQPAAIERILAIQRDLEVPDRRR